MPRRKYKKYKKKQSSYRSSFTKTRGAGLTKAFPLPKRFTFKTRYVDYNRNLNPGVSGLPATQVYHLTSLFDPDFTGAGHQPIGFDQIMPMYDHFTVIGARVRVTATNTDTAQAQTILLQLKDSVTLSTNVEEILENGMTRWTVLSAEGGGSDTKTLTYNFSAKKFYGKSPMDGDKYQGTITSSPAEGAFLHVIVSPPGIDTSPVRITTIIEYIAVLSEPHQLAQS